MSDSDDLSKMFDSDMAIAFASILHQLRADAMKQLRDATNDVRQMYIDDGYDPADASRMASDEHALAVAMLVNSLRGEQQVNNDDE